MVNIGPEPRSRGGLFYVRCGVAFGLIFLILHWVDYKAVMQMIGKTDLRYVLVVLTLSFFDRYLMACKWNMLLRARGIGFSNAEAFRIYLASGFVGTFLPTRVGADVFRALRTTVNGRKLDGVSATILVERIIGLLAVTVLALVGLTVLVNSQETQFLLLYRSVWAFFIVLAIGFFLSVQPWTFNFVQGFLARLERYRAIRMYLNFHAAFLELSRHWKVLVLFFVLSIGEQGVQCLILFSAAKAMGFRISIIYFVVISPLSLLVTTLPISINSIGILEGVYIVLFAKAGLSPTESLSLSLLLRVLEWIMLVPSGLVFLYDSMRSKQLERSPQAACKKPTAGYG